MKNNPSPPLSGRRAEAARNDRRILEVARHVFIADPEAPISAVAERAGVGISALYRRYRSKDDLLRRLSGDGLGVYIAEVERALASDADVWSAFAEFMRRVVEADTHALTLRLAGAFTPTNDLYEEAARASELTRRLLDRAKAERAIRGDIEVTDLSLLFEQLSAVRVRDQSRTRQLRHRNLALVLAALQLVDAPPLPGAAPTWDEFSERWDT
ncbi:MAG: TetR/AcrR family transcriptional regulator [Chloroflexota bacterium]|nr:TetR/AcrR family transcriptional regulator [Chloroflexota bacterium]